MFSVTTICITAFLTIFLHGQVPPALAGLALSYAAHISGVFQYTLRLVSEIEIRFISVERISSYIKVSITNMSAAIITLLGFQKCNIYSLKPYFWTVCLSICPLIQLQTLVFRH